MGAVVDRGTPATDLAARRVAELAISDQDVYPDGAVFLAADLPDFGRIIHRELLEGSAIVVIYPDGRERLVEPRDPRRETSARARSTSDAPRGIRRFFGRS